MKLTSLWKSLVSLPWLAGHDTSSPKQRRRTRAPILQPLEERRLLSITPIASYCDEQNVTLVVGTDYGLLAGAAGQNLSATLVDQPAHWSIRVHADCSFQYTPTPGFTGKDRMGSRVERAGFAWERGKVDGQGLSLFHNAELGKQARDFEGV